MIRSEQQSRSARMFWIRVLLLAFVFVGARAPVADAGPINLGVVSYDLLIPGEPDFPGVTTINIFNLTGDPTTGGFALEPDFLSYTPVTFLSSSLTVNSDGRSDVFDLMNIGPGAFAGPPELLFSETSAFTSLIFSATLSTTSFLLADGTTFLADSSLVSLTLLPSAGSALAPGDFGVISVMPVPEPGTLSLVVSGLLAIGLRSRMRRGTRRQRRFDLAPVNEN